LGGSDGISHLAVLTTYRLEVRPSDTGRRLKCMSMTEDEDQNRRELKTKRKRLYASFLKNPKRTRLAVEIKVLDDRLAGWTEPNKSKVLTKNVSST
jgi:hypothetical protein